MGTPLYPTVYEALIRINEVNFCSNDLEDVSNSEFIEYVPEKERFVRIIPDKANELTLLFLFYNYPIATSKILSELPNQEVIQEYKDKKYLSVIRGGKFLTEREPEYFEYVLKSNFSDSLELRNKYTSRELSYRRSSNKLLLFFDDSNYSDAKNR